MPSSNLEYIARYRQAQAPSKTSRYDQNHDAYIVDPHRMLFAVFDGIGLQHGARIASETACTLVKEELHGVLVGLQGKGYADSYIVDNITRSLSLANDALLGLQERRQEFRTIGDSVKLGTTVSLALCSGAKAYVAHIGDSAIFHYRNGILSRSDETGFAPISADHLADALFVQSHYGNKVENYLGNPNLKVRTDILAIEPHDRLIVATDGLSKFVHPREIISIITRNGTTAAADALLQRTRTPWQLPQSMREANGTTLAQARETLTKEGGDDAALILIRARRR